MGRKASDLAHGWWAAPAAAGLMALGAQVEIAWGPIPFILSDAVVLLTGLILGRRWAPVAVGLYLAAGAAGLPVFAGGGGGISHLLGSSGGYLWGFLLASVLISQILHRFSRTVPLYFIATASGQLSFFVLGVTWLKLSGALSWEQAIQFGFLDFWFPILLKLTLSVGVVVGWDKLFPRSLPWS